MAWTFLRTLFASQGSNGFMPKYIYLNDTYQDGFDSMPEFIGPYPGPKLFKSIEKNSFNNINVWSSNTLMASPYHATTILEVFYLSNQTTVDVDNMAFFYGKLKSWHKYLHDKTTAKCIESDASDLTTYPCLTVHHPWETEIDMQSPVWKTALNRLKDEVAISGWNPLLEIPDAVKESFEYPGDEVYDSLLYLLYCLSNVISDDENQQQQHDSHDHIQSNCPFSMIDVGFTAALVKSDQDLRQIQQILMDKNRISYVQREIDIAESRTSTSRQMLHALWNEEAGAFFHRIVELELNANGTYSSNKTAELDDTVAYNFNALWAPLHNATMVDRMVTQMVQRSGKFAYGCGDFALWSVGGCGETYNTATDTSPSIVPLLNYRVASGLRLNEAGLERYIQTSTLNLICGTPNSDESDLRNCSKNILFATAFNASTHHPLGKGACGLTSVLTASIALDLLSADKPFRYVSEPPISSSSVIILIAIEMILAMAIGLNCLILSLNLVRRANADEDDTFFHIVVDQHDTGEQELLVQSPGLSEGLDSPRESFDEAYNPPGILVWSTGILSRFNPLTALSVAPAPNGDVNQHDK